MKNFLTQLNIKEENYKILSMFGEKSPNPVRNYGRKSNNDLDKKPLNSNGR